jgi:ribosomal protein S18 acetylase RimI-like enzyme
MEKMKLQASAHNAGAIAFYEKHGWRTMQVRRRERGGGRE